MQVSQVVQTLTPSASSIVFGCWQVALSRRAIRARRRLLVVIELLN